MPPVNTLLGWAFVELKFVPAPTPSPAATSTAPLPASNLSGEPFHNDFILPIAISLQ
jgi:hypothetical protein